MIENFLNGAAAALPGAVISVVISGILLYYLRLYIDSKLKAEEQKREHDLMARRERSELEQKRRRAAGRMFFWLHHAVTKPPPNGELEDAWRHYNEIEEAQKALDQKILAEYETRRDV